MSTIQIKDLNESKEMDREAMRRVSGGRSGARFIQSPSPYRSLMARNEPADPLFGWVSLTLD